MNPHRPASAIRLLLFAFILGAAGLLYAWHQAPETPSLAGYTVRVQPKPDWTGWWGKENIPIDTRHFSLVADSNSRSANLDLVLTKFPSSAIAAAALSHDERMVQVSPKALRLPNLDKVDSWAPVRIVARSGAWVVNLSSDSNQLTLAAAQPIFQAIAQYLHTSG